MSCVLPQVIYLSEIKDCSAVCVGTEQAVGDIRF